MTTLTAVEPSIETATACMICGTTNGPDTVVCSVCGAPMALTHDATDQGREPCIVIGDSNVGKTVYLGVLLDMLSKRADNFEAVPRGAFSVNLQHTVISYLGARQFPPKTAMEVHEWQWAYYQVNHRDHGDKVYDLVMPDIAGEALAAEVASPNTFTVINSLLRKTAGAILLVDGAMAAAGSPQPDFFALKLMTYIDGICRRKKRKKIDIPVAIVLSKADYCVECSDDPSRFAKTNLNRLWNICENRFENFRFFSATVVGALGYGTDASENVVPYPLHIAPRGILEPFVWTLSVIGR